MSAPPRENESIPFWRDERVLQILGQLLVLGVVGFLVYSLYTNMTRQLAAIGLELSFDFLRITAQFDIGEKLIDYDRNDPYWLAYVVGVLNTIRVAILGIFFASIMGVTIGVARLSTNWLVRNLSIVYIEIFRNIPLLVFLIFWYTGAFLTRPRIQDVECCSRFYWSQRGISMPWGIPTETFPTFRLILIIGLVAAIILGYFLYRQGKQTGRMPLISVWSSLTLILFGVVAWLVVPSAPLSPSYPELPTTGFNMVGGLTLSPEFMALLSGLSLYTAAFIGEVVRAGIQSVSKGQVEASRALGLTGFQTLRLVVFPQAMRVIIPPLTSQYLNLTKNSSLAVAIGYADIVQVYNTTINQSGRAIEMTAILMLTYLTFSLITSAILNIYNRRTQLVER
jgi:general L-amino acid transport system permease protein